MRILSSNGRCITNLPREGILMVGKITRTRCRRTRATATVATSVPTPCEPLDEFKIHVEGALQCFQGAPVTPQRFLDLENALHAAAAETCRQILEREANRLEPDDKNAVPSKVRYHKETYRINKKTPATIATRFGTITVRSFYYLNEEDGEPGWHPFWGRLGIGAGAATPALLGLVPGRSAEQTPT